MQVRKQNGNHPTSESVRVVTLWQESCQVGSGRQTEVVMSVCIIVYRNLQLGVRYPGLLFGAEVHCGKEW